MSPFLEAYIAMAFDDADWDERPERDPGAVSSRDLTAALTYRGLCMWQLSEQDCRSKAEIRRGVETLWETWKQREWQYRRRLSRAERAAFHLQEEAPIPYLQALRLLAEVGAANPLSELSYTPHD